MNEDDAKDRAKVRDCWLAMVQMALRRYSGVTVDLEGKGRGISPKQIRAEMREYARQAVASLIRRGDIPRGICKPEEVRVEDNGGKGLTVHPPPRLVKWWDEKPN